MQDDIKKAVEVLQAGGTILYPTDTLWGLGCDATNAKAIEKINKIKKRDNTRSLIVLASSLDMVKNYVEGVADIVVDLVESYTDPLTVIYDNAKNLAKSLLAADRSIAIRIPRDEFCLEIIEALGKPITSTSANITGNTAPYAFSRVKDEIKEAVDYICLSNQHKITATKPSTIVRLLPDGNIQILRN